jgi:hypothetical protein
LIGEEEMFSGGWGETVRSDSSIVDVKTPILKVRCDGFPPNSLRILHTPIKYHSRCCKITRGALSLSEIESTTLPRNLATSEVDDSFLIL